MMPVTVKEDLARGSEYLRETPASLTQTKKRKKDKEEAKLLYFSEEHEQVIHDQLSMISTSLRYVNSDQYRKSQVTVRKNALMQCGKYFESMREFDVDNYEHHFSERRSSVFV